MLTPMNLTYHMKQSLLKNFYLSRTFTFVTGLFLIAFATVSNADIVKTKDPLAGLPSYREAYAMLEAKDFQGAQRAFDALLRQSSKSAGAFYGRARVRQELGDKNGSLDDCTKSLQFDSVM